MGHAVKKGDTWKKESHCENWSHRLNGSQS